MFSVFSIEHSKQLPILTNYIRHRMNNTFLDTSKLEELYYVKRIPMVQRLEKKYMLKFALNYEKSFESH